jgi:hypothetical protein
MSNPESIRNVVDYTADLWLTSDIPYYTGPVDINAASIAITHNSPLLVMGTVAGLSDASRYDVRLFDIGDIDYFKGVVDYPESGTWSIIPDTSSTSPRVAKIYDTQNDTIVALSYAQDSGKFYESTTNTGSKFIKLYDNTGTLVAEGYSGVGLLRSFILSTEDPAFAALGYRSFTYDQALSLLCACSENDSSKADFWASGLMQTQQVDDWFPFGVNTQSALILDPYYRTGAAMWCAYALLFFAQKYPASTLVDRAKNSAKQCLDMMIQNYYVHDPTREQYGSFTLGAGKYVITDNYQMNVGANSTLGNIGGDQEHCGVYWETSGQGTCSLQASPWRFDTLSTSHQKMGVMLRDENGDPTTYSNRGQEMVFLGVKPTDATTASWVFSYRTSAFDSATETTGALPAQSSPWPAFTPASAFLRLDKQGNTYVGYVRTDRHSEWTAVGNCTFSISSDGTYHKMLAASSGDAGDPAEVNYGELAGFDDPTLFSSGNLGLPDPLSTFAYFPEPDYGCAYLFDPTHKPMASSTEHNLDAYFALNLAGTVLGDGTYTVYATRAMNFLTGYMWTGEDGGRCRTGWEPTDGPDDSKSLDCHSWLSLAFANAGRLDLAVPALTYADHFGNTQYIPDTGGTASGYTAYIYPDGSKSEGIWVEGTYGVVMAKVACGSRTDAISMFEAMKPLKGVEGFPTKTVIDPDADQKLWTALGGTTWGLLCSKPQGFWGVNENIARVP